jgi:glycosyltransferase involved in cell wall biosynthesis
MRIVYLTHQYLPRHMGGTEIYLRGLARRAARSGHDVKIITCHESPSADPQDYGARASDVEGIPVLEIHFNLSTVPHPAQYEFQNPFVAEIVQRELESFRPDMVHVVHAMKLSGAAVEVCHLLGVPTVVTLCDFWFICPRHTLLKWDSSLCQGPKHQLYCLKCLQQTHGFATQQIIDPAGANSWKEIKPRLAAFLRDILAIRRRKKYLRRNLLKARRIIALSVFQKQMFVRNGFPEERIEVRPHGIELGDLRGPERRRNHPPRLIFIGSLVAHKGPHILIEALRRAPELAVNCRIYGALREDDPYVRQLREAAKDDPRIEFSGVFAADRLGEILGGADIFAMPAIWYENEPLVVQAALHLGVPIVASDIGSLPAMLKKGKNGRLVKPGDVAAWTDALRKMVRELDAFEVRPVPVKSMDDHAREILSIYEEEKSS